MATAINGLATGKEVNRYAGRINSKDVPFDSYTISFSGHIELEENGNADDDREWVFDKTVEINSGRISKQTTNFVFADYYYGLEGRLKRSARKDKDILKAISILNDPLAYRDVFLPQ